MYPNSELLQVWKSAGPCLAHASPGCAALLLGFHRLHGSFLHSFHLVLLTVPDPAFRPNEGAGLEPGAGTAEPKLLRAIGLRIGDRLHRGQCGHRLARRNVLLALVNGCLGLHAKTAVRRIGAGRTQTDSRVWLGHEALLQLNLGHTKQWACLLSKMVTLSDA